MVARRAQSQAPVTGYRRPARARRAANSLEAQQLEAKDRAFGDTLLSRLADQDIDLLVMGAYGHLCLRELVLGGVTRQIFQQMTVPVFMSH